MRTVNHFILMAVVSVSVFAGCATQRKLSALKEYEKSAVLAFMEESMIPELEADGHSTVKDTLMVTGLDGTEVLIMRAIKDDNGEMVAHDVLDAAKVTARFRNIAERNGKVNINFQVIVPEDLIDDKWQLRLFPDMFVLEDSIRLDPILITGAGYRRTQLKGYERYDRFVSSIITDTTVFIDAFLLDNFLRRNFREVYSFKNDTTFVTDEQWKSAFNVTGPEAVEHYTFRMRKRINERRKSRMDKMFRRYVKSPIITEGLRLDTVMRAVDGSFIYDYVQQINTRPKLRRVDIYLTGDIYEQNEKIYSIPKAGPLTFYISSLSSFVDRSERYLTKIVERRVSADTRCDIEFLSGSAVIDEGIGRNAGELHRIRKYLFDILSDGVFDLDSVVVTSYASPEGRKDYNESLSRKRAASLRDVLESWMEARRDSLRKAVGFAVDEYGQVVSENVHDAVRLISRTHGEDWDTLDEMIKADTVLKASDKAYYFSFMLEDLDRREYLMQSAEWYDDMKERIYPALRRVRLDFHMHRKGMVKDTVNTTVIDSVYMEGVKALVDMDYEKAVVLLRNYNDYNAAVAYLGTGRNSSAMSILEKIDRDARVNYLLAILYSRQGRLQEAVQCYIHACEQEPSYVHRGNLDPEISVLIENYSLNRQEEELFF